MTEKNQHTPNDNQSIDAISLHASNENANLRPNSNFGDFDGKGIKSSELETLNSRLLFTSKELEGLHSRSQENSDRIDTFHSNSGEKSDAIDAFHNNSEKKYNSIDTFYANAQAKSKLIDDFHSNSENKAGAIDALHSNLEVTAGLIETIYTNSNTKSGSIDAFHANSEKKSGEIDTLHTNTEKKSSAVDNFHANAQSKSDFIDSFYANSEKNSGAVETFHTNSKSKSELIDTYCADSEKKSRAIDTLHANSEEKSVLIDNIYLNSNKKSDEIDAFHLNAKEKLDSVNEFHDKLLIGNEEEESIQKKVLDANNNIIKINNENNSKIDHLREFYSMVFGTSKSENGPKIVGLKEETELLKNQLEILISTANLRLMAITDSSLHNAFATRAKEHTEEYKHFQKNTLYSVIAIISVTLVFGLIQIINILCAGKEFNYHLLIYQIGVSLPIIFMVWMYNRNQKIAKKLAEEYHHKSALSEAMTGYRSLYQLQHDSDEYLSLFDEIKKQLNVNLASKIDKFLNLKSPHETVVDSISNPETAAKIIDAVKGAGK